MISEKLSSKEENGEENPLYLKISEIKDYLEKRIEELEEEEKKYREKALKGNIKIN